MSEQWDVYSVSADGVYSTILVDLSLLPFAPDASKPNLLRVAHPLRVQQPDGLSHEREKQALAQVRQRLTDVLCRQLSATTVGAVTKNSRQEYYFYAPLGVDGPALQNSARDAMQIYPSYTYETGVRQDSTWTFYREYLYPRVLARQLVQNRRILTEMKQGGDILSVERPIFHWVLFKTDGERKTFIDAAIKLGFCLADDGLSLSKDGELPYSAELRRTDAALLSRIDEVTLSISRLARAHNGRYDGWETSIVRRTDRRPF